MPNDAARELLSLADRFKLAIGLKGYAPLHRLESMQSMDPMNSASGGFNRQSSILRAADDSAVPLRSRDSRDGASVGAATASSVGSHRQRQRRPSLGAMPSTVKKPRRFSTVEEGAAAAASMPRELQQWSYVQMVEPTKLIFREFPGFARMLRQHQNESFLHLINMFQAKLLPVIEHRQGTSADAVLPVADGTLSEVVCFGIALSVCWTCAFVFRC